MPKKQIPGSPFGTGPALKHLVLLPYLGLLSMAGAEDLNACQLKKLVIQLGGVGFKQRQTAYDSLMKLIEEDLDSAEKLRHHRQNGNPEIRFRIARLLRELPVTLSRIPPDAENRLKSPRRYRDSIKLTVKNRSKKPITCYWIDERGKRQPRRIVKPGEKYTYERTYLGHVWLLTDGAGKGLGIYIPEAKKNAQIIFSEKEGK